MRYSVLTLSTALILGTVSTVSAQTLRDDLDRATGVAPSATAPHGAPPQIQAPPAVHAPAMPPQAQPLPDTYSGVMPSIETEAGQLAQINQPAPDFMLMRGDVNAQGSSLSLKDIVAKGPAVIMFAPGSVTYTYPLMGLLQKNVANFQKVGVQPIAVSSDPVTVLRGQAYNFEVLSDPSGLTMRHYGAIKSGGVVTPVLVSINAQGVIVDMQETLNPDLNRAVRSVQRTEISSIKTEKSVTEVVTAPSPLVQIQQVTKEQNTIAATSTTVAQAVPVTQFPPVVQQSPAMPSAVAPIGAAPSANTPPAIPPAFIETQIQGQ